MGRYTTVQIYSDSNPSMRSVPYDQAAGTKVGSATTESNSVTNQLGSKGAVRPEKVDNPSGSTAGAGSGEFHVYRAARAREKSRIQRIDEEETDRLEQEAFEKKVWENMSSEQRKTEKRRRKRQREKNSKLRKKNMKLNGVISPQKDEDKLILKSNDEEFEYTPVKREARKEVNNDPTKQLKTDFNISPTEIKNDGSFLEMIKKKLAEIPASK